MTQQIIQSITNTPTLLAVIERKTKIPFYKKTHNLEVQSVTLHTMLQLTELVNEIKVDGSFFEVMHSNVKAPAKFLAIAIHNKPTAPPQWLVNTLMNDFTTDQISTMINVTYGRIGFESFFHTLGSMLQVNMIPTKHQEQTAPTP